MSIEIVKAPVRILYKSIKNFEHFVDEIGLSEVLNNGGFIAGGFPRYMINQHELDLSYFTNAPFAGKIHRFGAGDIDVFFKDRQSYQKCVKRFETSNKICKTDVSISFAGFALNKKDRYDDFLFNTQFVNCTFGSPEDVLGKFDFINSMIGFDNEFVYTSRERKTLEKQKKLMLNPTIAHNELLAWRIKRYCEKYNYTLDEQSTDVLKNYVFELLCTDDQHPFAEHLPTKIQNDIHKFNHENIAFTQKHQTFKSIATTLLQSLPDDLLLLFMGKIQQERHYNEFEIDLARAEMRHRLGVDK